MPERILIVDDEPHLAMTLVEILRQEGYVVDSARTGKEALEKLRRGGYDVAIVDHHLPDGTGLDLHTEIEKIQPSPATVLLTGYASIETVIEALRRGASDYLLKPAHPEELKRSVKQALERKKISEAAALQRKMDLLYQVGRSSAGETELDPFLKNLVEKLSEVLALPRCLLFLLTEEKESLVLKASNVPIEREVRIPVRRGILYDLLHEGKEVVAEEAQKDRRLPALLKAFRIRSLLIVPILLRGELLGVLSVDSGEVPHPFTDSEVKLARFIADQAAVGIENIRYCQRERDKAREFGLLAEIATKGTERHDERSILDLAIEKTVSLMGVDAGTVFLIDPERWVPTLSASRGPSLAPAGRPKPLSPRGLEGMIALSQKPWAIPDMASEKRIPPSERGRLKGWSSYLGVPLVYKGTMRGILAIATRKPRAFTPRDIALVHSIALKIALTIENVRLYNLNRTHREELRQLSLKVLSTQEEERRRISRELHDAMGQGLLALKLHLEILAEQIPPEMTGQREEIAEAHAIAAQTIEEIRRLVADLRPLKLDDLGLVPTLRGLVKDFSRKFKIQTHLKRVKLYRRLPPDMETMIYRIVQEALTNVAKHARATDVSIWLERIEAQVRVRVIDNGVGFDATTLARRRARRFGLVGIQERVDLMGGSFQILSGRGRGTELRVELPLEPAVPKRERILPPSGPEVRREPASTKRRKSPLTIRRPRRLPP
ncbi:MAG: GAF domain-containing protein [Candidatus Manganitrophaceae bacterium]|nr:MAG: GAF domain-containing protein [Candidatus Manganitrophaceae bacterium]